jgi:hypothetical protein
VDNIGQRGFERCVSEDILEEHGGEVDHGVETRRDTDDDQTGREKALGAPDVERHDWVVDLVLDQHECDQEDQANDEGGQGLGRCPATGGGLGQIEDHTNDAAAEGTDAEIVDTAVGNRGLALLGGNNDESEDDQKSTKHGCNVEHPSPT